MRNYLTCLIGLTSLRQNMKVYSELQQCKSCNFVLEESICKALSLTGVDIVPEDLQACHRMERPE